MVVRASFTTSHDMRCHTGGKMTLERGTGYTILLRQNINTKISAQACRCMRKILWTQDERKYYSSRKQKLNLDRELK